MEMNTNYTRKVKEINQDELITARRETLRVVVSFPVKCVLLPHREKFFYTVSKDLSLYGTKIISKDFLASGQEIMVYIDLIKDVVKVKTKVVCSNKASYMERYYVGLQFLEMNREDRQKLLNFLRKIHSS